MPGIWELSCAIIGVLHDSVLSIAGTDGLVLSRMAGMDGLVPSRMAGLDGLVPSHMAGLDGLVPSRTAGLDGLVPPSRDSGVASSTRNVFLLLEWDYVGFCYWNGFIFLCILVNYYNEVHW